MRRASPNRQLPMPGIPDEIRARRQADRYTVAPGAEVVYLGRISGGPRFGARGIVKEAYVRRAVVDMGPWGEWRIPYHFLTVPSKAA